MEKDYFEEIAEKWRSEGRPITFFHRVLELYEQSIGDCEYLRQADSEKAKEAYNSVDFEAHLGPTYTRIRKMEPGDDKEVIRELHFPIMDENFNPKPLEEILSNFEKFVLNYSRQLSEGLRKVLVTDNRKEVISYLGKIIPASNELHRGSYGWAIREIASELRRT